MTPPSLSPKSTRKSVFSISDVQPSDRFDLWRERLSTIFDTDLLDHDGPAPFVGEVISYMVGPMLVAKTTSSIQAFERTAATLSRSGIDHILLQYFLVGGNLLRTPQGEAVARPGDIQLIDTAQQSSGFVLVDEAVARRSSASETYANLSLIVARDHIEALLPAIHRLHGVVVPASDPVNQILRDHICSLYRNAEHLTEQAGASLLTPTVQLVANLFQGRASSANGDDGQLDDGALLMIRRYIARNIADPTLGPDQIATSLGMSRATLFRVCAPIGGVMASIRDRRLLLARRMLSCPRQPKPVKAAAFAVGFNSPSSFARCYKQKFGCSPSDTLETTRALQKAQKTTSHDPGHAGSVALHWLTNLIL